LQDKKGGPVAVSQARNRVFLSYNDDTRDFVEALARRLRGDGRLAFWFQPWHAVPGRPAQEQMEDALLQAQSCAVFIGGAGGIAGWQNEQMRAAIQTRVEDDAGYRVIPVLLPGASRPSRRDLPPFLRRYEMVEFANPDDETAFRRLLAGILGIPPVEVEGFIEAESARSRLAPPRSVTFAGGHAVVIGVAGYPNVSPLPATVLDDARDLSDRLTDPATCGYPAGQVALLLDGQATRDGIRAALAALAQAAGPDDTAVVFFSGHGARAIDPKGFRNPSGLAEDILPYDADLSDLARTAISGDEMTAMLRQIRAGRLLVLFDSCHSGGAGEPKAAAPALEAGLSEDYYAGLAQGKGRVVIASCRADEASWVLPGMRNSLFTHHLLEALAGGARTLGDGYVRVFDVFRHVADRVPRQASQHPIFKAAGMEEDFPIALGARKPGVP
jgi:hypothetical protein